MNVDIKSTIDRIEKMEALFDKVLLAYKNNQLDNPDIDRDLKALFAYYTGGEWLCDHEIDEAGLLPTNLKRGVLSEDGLYNLLCDINFVFEQ